MFENIPTFKQLTKHAKPVKALNLFLVIPGSVSWSMNSWIISKTSPIGACFMTGSCQFRAFERSSHHWRKMIYCRDQFKSYTQSVDMMRFCIHNNEQQTK